MYLGDASMESYHLNLNDENASESDIPDFEQCIIWQQETANELVTAAHNRVESGSGELVDM